jgi:hypothetical protein
MKIVGAVIVAVAGLLIGAGTASAAISPSAPADWSQYDTAVYVVSTLNVVRTRDAQPLVPLLAARYGVVRYAIWQDLQAIDYVIQPKRASGRNAGMLVYRLGWDKPYSFSRFTHKLGVPGPPQPIPGNFQTDSKKLIGTFASTLPS